MPQTTKKAAPKGAPLQAFGPTGLVIAESFDHGRTWKPTPEGVRLEEARKQPVPRRFTRRIAAVVDVAAPSLERRVATPFGALHEMDILGGWAPYDTLRELDEGDLDGIVIPGLSATPERVRELKRVGRSTIIDLELRTSLEGEEREKLEELLPLVDAVTVPTEIFASRLRSLHPHVFVVPDLLRTDIWRGQKRQVAPKRPFVKLGVPSECPDSIETALQTLQDKYMDRLIVERIDWWALYPQEEPERYLDLDIVVLPPPAERHQVGIAPMLPAMAAGCAVVADRLWPLIKHGNTGYHVGRDTPVQWAGTLNRVIQDGRNRITVGRAANAQARRWTPENRIQQIALPIRLVVPKSGPVSYA